MSKSPFLSINDSELIENNINVKDLMFFITLNCNLRCKTCYVGNKWLNSGISFSKLEVESILNHYGQKGLDRLTFLGGEPLTNPNITDYILFTNKFNIKEKRLTTNAIDLKYLDFGRLKGNELDHITVSFDGSTKETHEYVRGIHTFDRTVANVKKLIKHGFKIHANLTVSGYNKDQVVNSVSFFKNLGIREVNFHLISMIGNASSHPEFKIGPKEWISIRQQLTNIKDVHDISLRIPYMYVTKDEYQEMLDHKQYYPIQEKSYHSSSGQRIVLYPNGRVYISCDLTGSDYNFASYKKGAFSVLKNLNELSFFKQRKDNPDVSSYLLRLDNQGYVRLSISFKQTIKL